ncbi:MAG: hypothetical protein M5U28_46520 [Sandaracinaceae bacterium]|nr:hypothetical protein [Sandaracinaceae bacterium]
MLRSPPSRPGQRARERPRTWTALFALALLRLARIALACGPPVVASAVVDSSGAGSLARASARRAERALLCRVAHDPAA